METLAEYWPIIVAVISTLAGSGILARFVPDKYLTWFMKTKTAVDAVHEAYGQINKELNKTLDDKKKESK